MSEHINIIVDVLECRQDKKTKAITASGILTLKTIERTWNAEWSGTGWKIKILNWNEMDNDIKMSCIRTIEAAIGAIKVPYRHVGSVVRV